MLSLDPETLALIALGLVFFGAALTALAAAFTLIRRKVRKEIGLWKRHRRYRPAPAPRNYTLE